MNLTASAAVRQPLTLHWPTALFLGSFHGMALLALWNFSWSALGVTLFLHWLIGGVGICLGYHRLLSHRSFQVPQWLAYGIAVLGALALQGGPIFWVGWHRQHHAHTETDLDPYSAQRGFWWSHILWMLYPRSGFFSAQTYAKYAPELVRDPFYRWLDRYYLTLQIPLGLLLFGLGGWSFVIYGIFLRTVLVWHSTWLVNSAAHLYGYRTIASPDNARNSWWVALLTYGEGWHNHHHAHPRAAKTGWHWWEVDTTWWVISTLQTLGLAKNVMMLPANFDKSSSLR
ncbi:fatty acid desaturase [Candidatus Cyanaurora vandensis]|uniref:acyl-CoA desaturase n=1 Tax=Candidatus Cyanaurora vandensis TaxID=2714958 RepID=UPI00257C2735|nr:fatty acid desaturase [Candidatus Cyanaurora vandensis]